MNEYKYFPTVISISGKKGSGKDTVGKEIRKILEEMDFNTETVSFAGGIRKELTDLIHKRQSNKQSTYSDNEEYVLSILSKSFGEDFSNPNQYNMNSRTEPIAEALMYWGESQKNIHGPMYWVSKVKDKIYINKLNNAVTIITDTRYQPERAMISKYKSLKLYIDVDKDIRAGRLEERDGFVSNVTLNSSGDMMMGNISDYDYVIKNNGTVDELKSELRRIIKEVYVKNRPRFIDTITFQEVANLPKEYGIEPQKVFGRYMNSDDLKELNPGIPRLWKLQMGKKVRDLYIFPDKDMLQQQLMLHYMEDLVLDLIHPSVYSYRKHRSTLQVARLVQRFINKSNETLYKFDIHDFFNSISRDHIIAILDKLKDSEVDSDIIEYIEAMIHSDVYEYKGEYLTGRPTMPQGSSLSALISNMVLYEFDKTISESCSFYVRYADDILTTALPENVCPKIREMGFEINEKKTKIYKDNESIEYLGFVISKNMLSLTKEKIREKYLGARQVIRKSFKWAREKNVSKDDGLIKAINSINRYWFLETVDGYSRFRILISKIDDIDVYRELDKLVMRAIISEYTQRHNKYMYNLLSYEGLHEKGYISLVYMFNVYQGNRSHYQSLSSQAIEYSNGLYRNMMGYDKKKNNEEDKEKDNKASLEWD